MSLVAQTLPAEAEYNPQSIPTEDDIVSYPASFFSRYQPNSALDMLEQLPGFRPDMSSGELRGYGNDAGNVLIDGRRPSSKRVTVPSILDRIPASQVDRIELIRGPVRDIELLGEPEVANVVLLTDVPAAVRWIFTGYRNSEMDPLPLFSNISLSDRWANIDFNAGFDIFRMAESDRNDERILNGSNSLIEKRIEKGNEREFEGNFDVSASTWVGETFLTWNSQIGIQEGDEIFHSQRTPQSADQGVSNEYFDGYSDEFQFEVGFTMERNLASDIRGNLLIFLTQEIEDATRTQISIDSSGVQTAEKLKDTDQIEREAIARTELEWTGLTKHTFRFNLEGTYNLVDNKEVETEDTGAGPVTIFVPGATTILKEYRGELLLKDIWNLGNLELDYGLGAEISKITQTGDPYMERNLSYLKPQLELSYTHDNTQKARLRLAREVAQLRFMDFVSMSLFVDEDLALGNPNLRPEATWISEFGYERRFGRENVYKITLFHHWINDVQDFVPMTLTEEAPGNLGKGRRWGIQVEGTVQLDWLGLNNARLDLNARWQDSTVIDPVTSENRVLSSTINVANLSIFDTDNEYAALLEYRQDFEVARLAWGWDITYQGDLLAFKVNELDSHHMNPNLNLFIETTRWFGLKLRLELNNLLNWTEERERTIYNGERDLSSLLRRQLQDRTNGREIGLTLSGSF